MIGVRDSRRIMGEYVLTGEDIISSVRFEDAIARDWHGIDIHHPTGPENVKTVDRRTSDGKAVEQARHQPGSYNEIPYRCLVPLKIENLLVAGRCVSCDFAGQSGTRLVLACLNMGQAVGTAAALSITDDVTPRQLDAQKLREKLAAQGVNLLDKPGSRAAHAERSDKLDDPAFKNISYARIASEVFTAWDEDRPISSDEVEAMTQPLTDVEQD